MKLPPKLTKNTDWLQIAQQMGIRPTIHMLNQLAQFRKIQGQPVQKLYEQLSKAEHNQTPPKVPFKIRLKTLWECVGEIIIGTALLIVMAWAIAYAQHTPLPPKFVCYTIGATIMVIILLYYFILKPTMARKWHRLAEKLNTPQVIIGLTQENAKLYYPLMILAQKNHEWLTKLRNLNPRAALAISTKGETP